MPEAEKPLRAWYAIASRSEWRSPADIKVAFGMNVDFPGYGTGTAFWIVVGVMITIGAGLLGFFRWRRWL